MAKKANKKKEIIFSTQISKQGEMRVVVIPKTLHKEIEDFESKAFRNGKPMKVTMKLEEL